MSKNRVRCVWMKMAIAVESIVKLGHLSTNFKLRPTLMNNPEGGYASEQHHELPCELIDGSPALVSSQILYCDWKGCTLEFATLPLFIIHVKQHVLDLEWLESGLTAHRCEWHSCWSQTTFNYPTRLIGIFRVT